MNTHSKRCYVNQWLLDIQSGSIVHKESGEVKRLGEYQLKLLQVLIQHAGEVLSREQLTNLVWERRVIGNNSLPNAIHALRLALEDDGKNQRIIKTIPKKGYLLESGYCQDQEPLEEATVAESGAAGSILEADLPLNSETIENFEAIANLTPLSNNEMSVLLDANQSSYDAENPYINHMPEEYHPDKTADVQKNSRYYWAFIWSLAVITVLLLFSAFFFMPERAPVAANPLVITEDNTKPYNNIQLYQINVHNRSVERMLQDNLYERLKESLTQINLLLDKHQAELYAYYRTSDPVLNYSFVIENRCDRKEYSMNIYHWRLNSKRLNTLIYQETERKINEMSTCNS